MALRFPAPGGASSWWRVNGSLLLAASLFLSVAESAPALDAAIAAAVHSDLAFGRADQGIGRLQMALARDSHDADSHNLLCRILYQEQRWNDAIHECEQAVESAPASSDYHMWLGRAYGQRANSVSFVEAYRISRKVRSEFETAASLDPHNAEAQADLGEFYTEAPAIIGGGLDKAEDIARRMETFDTVRAHELRGEIAEERKDAAGAEREFKAEIGAARNPAEAWTVLASFYRRHERWDDMTAAVRGAVAADREHGVASAYAAEILIKANREPLLAIRLLESYLSSQKQSEDAPAFQAHVQLGHLYEEQGDKQAAQREIQAARLLAKDYRGLP